MTLISGLRVAWMSPKIRPTASSVPTLVQPLPASSSIPDTAQVATPRAAAETSTRSRNLINQILLEFGAGWGGESVELVWGFAGCGLALRQRNGARVPRAPCTGACVPQAPIGGVGWRRGRAAERGWEGLGK